MADKKTLFSIGSSLDQDNGWKKVETKAPSVLPEMKLPSKHLLVLKMEKRQGKPVSIVGPFFLSKHAMQTVCSTLKKKLGSGGTLKEEWMEFQGECRDKLKQFLEVEGFRFKA